MQSRQLLPASESRRIEETEPGQSSQSRAPTKVACERCRKQKTKCDGIRPICQRCNRDSANCVYLAAPNESRSVSLQRRSEAQERRIELLSELLRTLSEKSDDEALEIVRRLRSAKSEQDFEKLINLLRTGDALMQMSVRQQAFHIPELSQASISREITQFVRILESKTSGMEYGPRAAIYNFAQTEIDSLASKMPKDIESSTNSLMAPGLFSLNGPTIIQVQAKPWTDVNVSDRLVSHLVSLFFTWDFHYTPLIPRERFLTDMRRGNLDTKYCSKFLVNALLALEISSLKIRCHLSPRFIDITLQEIDALGEQFFSQAQVLWDEEDGRSSLTNLLGLHLLCIRYIIVGSDQKGALLSSEVVVMLQDLEILNPNNGNGNEAPEMLEAQSRAAWGLFQSLAMTHATYLHPSPLPTLQVPRPKGNPEFESIRDWVPYPLSRPPVLEYFDTRFDRFCDLCMLSNEVLVYLADHRNSQEDLEDLWQGAVEISERLVVWLRDLPGCLRPTDQAASHILTLNMQYECTIMALFAPFRALNGPSFAAQKQRAREMYLEASISLGNLLRLHQFSYGSFCGPSGIIQYASWCVSALLDYAMEQPELQSLVHDATMLLLNFSFRLKLGAGLLRVTHERMSTLPRGTVLQETMDLLDEFKDRYWKNEYEEKYNSLVPEFALASREILRRKNIRAFQLRQILSRVPNRARSAE